MTAACRSEGVHPPLTEAEEAKRSARDQPAPKQTQQEEEEGRKEERREEEEKEEKQKEEEEEEEEDGDDDDETAKQVQAAQGRRGKPQRLLSPSSRHCSSFPS